MFGKQKISAAQKLETVIGKETVMSGNLDSKGSIRIDGCFQGDIMAQNDVIIGEEALVQAHINCSNVILAGRVEGNINTAGKLDIRATGVLIGDAKVGALIVEDGAVLTGYCKMSIREDKRLSTEIFGETDSKKIQEQQAKVEQVKNNDNSVGKDQSASNKNRSKKR